MGYDPRLLPSFIALAEELHFGRAAARLHLARSSQQIGRLETQLGVALFVRHTRSVALPAAGQAFLAGARSAVASARQTALDARQAAAGGACCASASTSTCRARSCARSGASAPAGPTWSCA